MNNLKLIDKNIITSIDLLEQINLFRTKEEKTELLHKNLLKLIRDEFDEEIEKEELKETTYLNKQNKLQPMFSLSTSQAKQLLVRESKYVRKAVIKYLERLEVSLIIPNNEVMKIPENYADAVKLAYTEKQEKEQIKAEFETFKNTVDYVEKLTKIDKSYLTITQIASNYGLKGSELNLILRDAGFIKKSNNQWILCSKYLNKGYSKTIMKVIKKTDGTESVIYKTMYSQAGRVKIHEIVNKNKLKIGVLTNE